MFSSPALLSKILFLLPLLATPTLAFGKRGLAANDDIPIWQFGGFWVCKLTMMAMAATMVLVTKTKMADAICAGRPPLSSKLAVQLGLYDLQRAIRFCGICTYALGHVPYPYYQVSPFSTPTPFLHRN